MGVNDMASSPGRRRAAIAITAVLAATLAGCAPTAQETALRRCMVGQWNLDVQSAASGMARDFAERGVPITRVGVTGAQLVTFDGSGRVMVQAGTTWTASGAHNGQRIALVQKVTGVREADADLDGDRISFSSVSGMLDEDLTATRGGEEVRRHYRMPSTAIIGRPGTVTCQADALRIERLHGVTLDFTRAG
jgi:hypothetical protein